MCFKKKKSAVLITAEEKEKEVLTKTFVSFLNFIPYVGDLINVADGLVDYSYSKKVVNIVKMIEGIGSEKEQKRTAKFLNKKLSEESHQQTYGELILNVVSEMNDSNQAKLVGRLLNFYYSNGENKLHFSMFYKLIHNIKNSYIYDLDALEIYRYKDETVQSDDERLEYLKNYGFLTVTGFDGGNFVNLDGGEIYRLNEYGKLLFDCLDRDDFDIVTIK